MRKTEIVAGSCIALLAIVSIGQMYLENPSGSKKDEPAAKEIVKNETETAQAETKAVTVDEVIETYLSSLQEGTDVGKQVALGSLLDELEGPEFGKSELKAESGEAFAKAAIAVVESAGPETQAPAEFKARVAGFVASRTHGPSSRDFAMKVLDGEDADARRAVLRGVGSPNGVGGRKVFDKVSELGAKGLIAGT